MKITLTRTGDDSFYKDGEVELLCASGIGRLFLRIKNNRDETFPYDKLPNKIELTFGRRKFKGARKFFIYKQDTSGPLSNIFYRRPNGELLILMKEVENYLPLLKTGEEYAFYAKAKAISK